MPAAPQLSLAPRDRAARQAELRKALKKRGVAKKQPMQSQRELRAIPEGIQVVAHLLKSATKASHKHQEMLIGLGLLEDRRRGRRRRAPSGHVGRAVELKWKQALASSGVQEVTRFVFFDSGEPLFAPDRSIARQPTGKRRLGDASDNEEGARTGRQRATARSAAGSKAPVSATYFQTSLKHPAAVLVPTGGSRRPVQLEAQPDGFGIIWPSRLGPVEAVRGVLELLPTSGNEDAAMYVRDGQNPVELEVKSLLPAISEEPEEISYLRIEVGHTGIAWAREVGDGGQLSEMSMGGDSYAREPLDAILSATADLPDRETIDAILSAADDMLPREAQRTP